MEKIKLRRRYLRRRQAIPVNLRQTWDRQITQKLCQLLFNLQPQTVACYLPIKDEVATKFLIGELLQQNKTVVVPRQMKQSTDYVFVSYSLDDYDKQKRYGQEGEVEIPFDQIDIVVCPGLAFDMHGIRLGFGGGAYDRMLSKIRHNVLKIGLCYQSQLVEQLPQEEHDIPMNIIVTEENIIICK